MFVKESIPSRKLQEQNLPDDIEILCRNDVSEYII